MPKISLKFIKIFTSVIIASVLLIISLNVYEQAQAAIGVNKFINFQGKLVANPSGTNVSNTSYSVVFTIYDKSSGGTALWTETQTVTTSDGIFRVQLGAVTAFPANMNWNWSDLYLGIKVGADSEMTPRVQLTSVPFALNSQTVAGLTVQDTAGNASTSGILQVGNGKTISFSDNIAFGTGTTGTISLGTGTNTLQLRTTNNTDLTLPTTGTLCTTVSCLVTDQYWNLLNGSLFANNSTLDFLFGSQASNSARFKLTANNLGAGTLGVASISGQTSFATFVIDNSGTGDLFTASKAGQARFTVKNNGSIIANAYQNCTLKTDTNGLFTCGTDLTGSGGYSPFQELSGAIAPNNSTTDFLVGGQTTASARFAVLGVNSANTVASVAGNFVVMPQNGWGGQVGIGYTNPGTSALAVNGSVGIGTNTPDAKLAIKQADNNGSVISNILSLSHTSNGVSGFTVDTASSLTTGLVSYWKFDESSGGLFSDSVGSNNGSATGTSIVAGKLNNARNYNGSSDKGVVTGPTGLPVAGSTRSVFAWVKPTNSNTTGGIVSWGSNGTGTESGLDVSSGKAFFVGFNADVTGSTSLNAGTWYLIGYTYDGSNIRVYVNGVLDGGPTARSLNTSTSNLGIGYDLPQNTLNFNGSIDEVGIWSKQLSSTEITDLYNASAGNYYNAASVASGIGSGILFENQNLSAISVSSARISGLLTNASNGNEAGALTFETITGGGVLTERARVDGSGNFAIGTTSATATFDVNGTASFAGQLSFRAGFGQIQSNAFNSLTIGGNTTGQLILSGFNGAANGITMAGYSNCTLKTTSNGVVTCGTDLTGSASSSPFAEINGTIVPINLTEDFLFGSQASNSATFHLFGNSAFAGTQPVASIGAKTSYAAFVIDQSGVGELFTASRSGKNLFTILNNGSVYTQDLMSNSLILGTSSGSLITAFKGFNSYTNFSSGIGTGGYDSVLGAQRITSDGDLSNIGSIQGGETLLTSGGIFAAKQDTSTGTTPEQLAAGDLNGDGKTDLVAVNNNVGSLSISVFINRGDGSFDSTDYPTGSSPWGVAIGDLNGDGRNDVVVTNSGSASVSVFINKGNGILAPKQDFGVGSSPIGVAIGDLNGDGKNDLIVTNNQNGAGGNSISVLINTGFGNFADRVNYTTGTQPNGIAVADVNGDGKLDVAVANGGSTSISIFYNLGDGTLSSKQDYTVNTTPYGIVLADLNNDSRADVAVTNSGSANVSVLMNKGDGSFGAKTDYTTGTTPNYIAVGDVNGDGKNDLAFTNSGQTSMSVLLNLGTGTFQNRTNYTANTTPRGIIISDLNGDGKKDIAITNLSSSNISVYLNQTTTILYAQASTGTLGIGTSATPTAMLDVRGVGLFGGTLAVASISGKTTYSALITNNDLIAGDLFSASSSSQTRFTIKGNGSIIANAYQNCTLKTDSNGLFTCGTDNTGSGSSSPFAELNGAIVSNNSTEDFFIGGQSTASAKFAVLGVNTGKTVASVSGNFIVMPQNGWGGFVGIGTTAPSYNLQVVGTTYTTNLMANDIIIATSSGSLISAIKGYQGYTNFSGGLGVNGIERLTLTGNLTNIGSIQAGETLLTNGGTFATNVDYTTGTNPQSVAIGDLDGDGKSDMAVANNGSTGASGLSTLINNGDGTYATQTTYTTGSGPISVALGDLNGDGKSDVVVANFTSGTISTFMNKGDGTLSPKVDYTTGTSTSFVAIGDLNGDGKSDVVVTNRGSTSISVFINKGDGSLLPRADYTVGTFPMSVAIGDLNGDGKLDLAVAHQSSSFVSVLLNKGDGSYPTRADYATAGAARSVAIGDLNSDGKLDIAVGENSGLIDVFINIGNGVLSQQDTLVNTSAPYSVAIGDLNGDGKSDIAAVNNGSALVSVYLNGGSNDFYPKVDYTVGSSPYSVAIGDLNGDGKLDLAVANNSSTSVSVLINQTMSLFYAQASTGYIGIGISSTPSAVLDVRGTFQQNAGILAIASISGNTSYAALVTNNDGVGNLFSASSSGQARFTISGNGSIIANAYKNCTLKTDTNGLFTCGTDLTGSGSSSPFAELNGTIVPVNLTEDLLFGSLSSSSARFKLTANNLGAGTLSVASISGQTSFAALVVNNDGVGDLFTASASGATRFTITRAGMLDSVGPASIAGSLVFKTLNGAQIQTSSNQALTIGGNTTGQITISSLNGTQSIRLAGYTTAGCTLKADNTGLVTCGTDNTGGAGASPFTENTTLGTIFENNNTEDFLIGGTTTASAKFAIVNIAGGEPTASIAGSITLRNGTGYINRLNGGDITFQTSVGGDSALAPQLTIKNNGWIGAGTTAPLAAFDIRENGTMAIASISGKTSYAGLVVDNSGNGALISASASGNTLFTVRQNGSVGIGNGTSGISSGFTLDVLGNARIGSSNTSGDDILKQTTSDFTQGTKCTGTNYCVTTSVSVDQVSTANNQLQLVTDLIGAGASISTPGTNNSSNTVQNIGQGAVVFQRPDSKFIVVAAGASGTRKTVMYDNTNNVYQPGPDLPLAAGPGTNAFQRQNGKFVVLMGGTNQTTIYTATGSAFLNGSFAPGATLSGALSNYNFGAGSQIIRRSDGKFIVIIGNGTWGSAIYDPAAGQNSIGSQVYSNPLVATDSGSFTPGPNLTNTVTTGSFVFETINGKWIVGLGGNATNFYDPSTGAFSAGPSLAGGATTGAGAHVIQRPDYKYLLILGGGSQNTQVYDPATNSWTNSSTPTLSAGATSGAHSFQRSDSKWITVLGGASTTVNLYDPTNGANGTYTDPGASSYLANAAGVGALTFQRPDGKYIVLSGNNGTANTIYDAGWNTTGTWTSEAIASTNISTYSALLWSGDPQSTNNNARLDKSTTSISVRTAANTAQLSTANWMSIANSGNLIGGTVNPPGAIQFQVTFNTPVRSYPQLVTSTINQSNIWGGEGSTFNRRSFLQPTIYSLRVTNPLVQYGGMINDPSYGRNFATAGALLEGVVTDNNNQLALAINRNLPTATNSAGFIFASASATLGFSTGVGTGGMTLQLPNGQYLIIPGNSLTTTRIYDPDTNTFSAGPNTPTAAAAGGHAFQLPDGKFFIVLGGNTKNTAIYDPAANVFYAGPLLANPANTGSQTFQRPDGLYIILAGTTVATNIYDPFLNQVTAGPALTTTAGAGTIILRRPDGRITVMLGGTAVGNTYDYALNAFTPGPNMTTGTLVAGSTAIQLSTGRFLVKASTTTSQTLDPITSTYTVGPAAPFTQAAGSFVIPKPDGKVLLAQGGTVATTIYDPNVGATNVTGAFALAKDSPSLPCSPGAGANTFQRQDGAYVVICGAGTNNIFVADAGWNLGGTYFSEQIYEPNLSANSAIFWQNAGNQGNIYVKYRTASSQAALGVSSWKDARYSGYQIAYNSGDTWIQTRFDLQGSIPDNPGAKSKVWLSTDTGMVTYYRTVSAPILSYWKLMNNQYSTLLTLTANGSNAFRFSADGQAYTNSGGAWNSGGADLAERYTSTQSLEAGDVVIGDIHTPQNVVRSTDAYQANIMGVVSTQPGFVAGSYTPNSYPIALVGRVPVKVSTENGVIHAGDYLTSASIPGYAMKATTAGRVLGTALEDFDSSNTVGCPKDGAGSLSTTQCSTLVAFINLTNYNGQNIELVMADKGFASTQSAGITTNSGLSSYLNDVEPKNSQILEFLSVLKNGNSAELNSQVFTGRLSALDIVSPNIVADMITAKTIRADRIEGLEVFTNQLSALSKDVSNLSSQGSQFATSSAGLNLQGLNVLGIATVSADFNVGGNSFVQGALSVLSSITTQNLFVTDYSVFFKNVLFKKDVTFEGRPTFNSDTAGFAVVNQGSDTVDVTYDTEYNNTPIVTASIVLDKQNDIQEQKALETEVLSGNISYVITNRTTKGFTIKLNKVVDKDISFSWVSLAVKDARVQSSNSNKTNVSNNPSATQSAGFQSILNQLNNTSN